ncbi:uncharacterized protein LOC135490944 [Lineus longissimus]|uniref:uncharacterized protein LOC135490944 n=1 Tax=Lineus longissimus TaxID=88925 RepID=UPI00315D461A
MNVNSTDFGREEPDFPFLQAMFDALTKYVWVLPVAFGIPGNILTMLVANRKHNRKLSPCVYMSAMAATDLMFLLEVAWYYSVFFQGMLDHWIDKAKRGLIVTFHVYLILALGMLSGLCLAAMSVDRLLAIRFPLAAAGLCTTKRAKITVVLITVPIAAINVHTFFVYDYIEDLEAGSRFIFYDVPVAIEKASSLFNIIFGTVVPSVLIFGCNLLIIITVKKAAANRAVFKSNQTVNKDKDSPNLAAMLLFVSIAYIITTFPYRLFAPIIEIPTFAAMYDMTQPYWRLSYNIGLYVLADLWFCNYAVNFYLYCIGGGKRYRDDTKAVIGQIVQCCK